MDWAELSIVMADLTFLSSWAVGGPDSCRCKRFWSHLDVMGSGKVRSSQHIGKDCSKFNIQMCQSRSLANGVAQIMRLTFFVADFHCIFPCSSRPLGENAAEFCRGKALVLVVKLGEASSPETACRHDIPIYVFLWKGRHRTRETLACVSHKNPQTSSAHWVHKFRHWSCTVRCPLKRDLPTLFPSTWTWDVNYAVLTTNSVFKRFGLPCRVFTYCLDLRHACSVWNLGTYTKANQWELRNPEVVGPKLHRLFHSENCPRDF